MRFLLLLGTALALLGLFAVSEFVGRHGLHAETTRRLVHIAGAGTTTLWSEKSLDVRITGVGTVRYYGDPQIVDRHVVGVGNVKRMQGAPGS